MPSSITTPATPPITANARSRFVVWQLVDIAADEPAIAAVRTRGGEIAGCRVNSRKFVTSSARGPVDLRRPKDYLPLIQAIRVAKKKFKPLEETND